MEKNRTVIVPIRGYKDRLLRPNHVINYTLFFETKLARSLAKNDTKLEAIVCDYEVYDSR